MTTTAFNDPVPKFSTSNTPPIKGGIHTADGSHRYGGGSGDVHRLHFPAADDVRFSDATYGGVDHNSLHGEAEVVPESKINTMNGGQARGTMGGKMLPRDRGGFT